MEPQQNNISFLTTILKNRFIFGVIASVIVLTVGIFKTIKSSSSSQSIENNNNDDNNNKNNKNKNTTPTPSPTPIPKSTHEEQDQLLKDLQEEINKLKPLTTSIDSEITTTTSTTTKTPTPIKSINKNNNTSNNNNIIQNKKAKELISLPHQILYQIFELITPQDFIACSQLNKKWNSVLNKLDKCWIQYSIDRWNLQQNYPFDETKNNNKEFFKKRYLKEIARLGFKPEQYIVTIMNQCSEFTESGRWKTEAIINSNSWWKKRFIEEMNKCLTMSTFLITNNNSNSNSKKIKNEDQEDDDEEEEDEEEEEEEDEDEKEGIENRCCTGNIILSGKVNTTFGSFRFIDKEDALLKFKNEVWIDRHYTAEDSPYTGDVVGYFNFSLFPLDCDDEVFQPYKSVISEFLRVLTFGTRGTVTRLKTNYSVNSIVFEQCPLSSIFGKYGFNDGDALLDTDLNSSYIVQLIEEIQNFLDKKNIGSNSVEGGAKVIYTDKTSHNPIRYSGHLSKESLQYELGLWIYNSVILQSKRLWNRRLED